MSSVLIQVRDNDTGSETTRELGEFHAVWSKGVLVGSDSTCDIVLADPGIAGKHVRLSARSNHKFLEVLEGDPVVFLGRAISAGQNTRVDGMEFRVGRYTLRVVGGNY